MFGSITVLEASGQDRERWLELFEGWREYEAFAHPAYLSAVAASAERPVCVVHESPKGRVLHPIVLRDVRLLAFHAGGDALFDATSPPYGWAGPFVQSCEGDRAELLQSFYSDYASWALGFGLVAEYATFFYASPARAFFPGKLEARMPIVVRELHGSLDEIWSSYKPSLRNRVRQAETKGVSVEIDLEGNRSAEFLEIYSATMDRNQAANAYSMSRDQLERLNRELRGRYAYFHALHEGKLVSTELVLVNGTGTFFFRGGTLREHYDLHPNHLLKHSIIKWSLERNLTYYYLGGGNAATDPLFQFKKAFAPNGVHDLQVGKWVLSPARYQQLVEARRAAEPVDWVPRAGFFPEYRA